MVTESSGRWATSTGLVPYIARWHALSFGRARAAAYNLDDDAGSPLVLPAGVTPAQFFPAMLTNFILTDIDKFPAADFSARFGPLLDAEGIEAWKVVQGGLRDRESAFSRYLWKAHHRDPETLQVAMHGTV